MFHISNPEIMKDPRSFVLAMHTFTAFQYESSDINVFGAYLLAYSALIAGTH
jgi:hypothetical protein